MVRTQIYLTEDEQAALRNLAVQTGQTQSALIRQAIDRFIAQRQPRERKTLLQQAKGMWRDREDLPDFRAIRKEMDRRLSGSGE